MNPRNPLPSAPRGATPETRYNIELTQIERRMQSQQVQIFRNKAAPKPNPIDDRDVPAYLRRRMSECDWSLAFTERGAAERMKAYAESLLAALDTAGREAA